MTSPCGALVRLPLETTGLTETAMRPIAPCKPSPRWAGLSDCSLTQRSGFSDRSSVQRLPQISSHQASSFVCPSGGLLKELQTPRKVKALDTLLTQVREDKNRYIVKASTLRRGVEQMLESIDDATFIATNDARGQATVRHGASSPMSHDGGAIADIGERLAATEVLENIVQEAAVRGIDTPFGSSLPSRVSTAGMNGASGGRSSGGVTTSRAWGNAVSFPAL
eukprot:TRINITY_DN57797_c0_g1_i1.p1 TRINITY_DN57797_c0_g1~~TRINITY_DN57797_c0_g1_i1.p1  ORF type:complete len:223 (-),score=28.62 TRINITY_DN57797_c0_g1_i1:214-882(-)